MSVAAYAYAGYVAAGWILTFAGFLLFVVLTLRRGRELSDRVPPEERRWS